MTNSVGRPVLLYISNDRTAFLERGAEFRAVNVYNKLPVEIKNINSYICLKKIILLNSVIILLKSILILSIVY